MSWENNCTFYGRLARDPELKTVGSGDRENQVVNFTLAVDNYGKDNGAEFINCVAWGKTASNIANYTHKGSRMGVRGELHNNSYTDKDGVKRSNWIVKATDIKFIDTKSENGGSKSGGTYTKSKPKVEVEDEDDFPF